jgi:hypothetical protein
MESCPLIEGGAMISDEGKSLLTVQKDKESKTPESLPHVMSFTIGDLVSGL